MKNILILCRTNSVTSMMVEALVNNRAVGNWRAFSAGSDPAIAANAYTLSVLKEAGLPVESGRQPKDWKVYEGPDAPRFEVVLTVSEDVAWEQMPVWNGVPRLLHWALPDPLSIATTGSERAALFKALFQLVRAKVDAFLDEEAAAMRTRPLANDNRSTWFRNVGT